MTDASEIAITDDLPDELKAQLITGDRKMRRGSKYRPIILRLLGTHGDLDKNQLITGIYRSTEEKKIMSRDSLGQHLGKMKAAGLVKPIAGGKFGLTDKAKKMFADAAKPAGRDK